MVPLEKIEEELHDILGTRRARLRRDRRAGRGARRAAGRAAPRRCDGVDVRRSWCAAAGGRGLPNLWVPAERDFFPVPELPMLGSGKLDLKRRQGAGAGRWREASRTACRVVLVRTEIAGNLGATARVMRNFGCADLVLVAPVADPRSRAGRAAVDAQASDPRPGAASSPDLDEAVADCVLVAGTSARTGGLFRRQTVGPPDEIAAAVGRGAGGGTGGAGLRPGAERPEQRRGRRAAITSSTSRPTRRTPALNLAQAVAICLYELRRAWLCRARAATSAEVAP